MRTVAPVNIQMQPPEIAEVIGDDSEYFDHHTGYVLVREIEAVEVTQAEDAAAAE